MEIINKAIRWVDETVGWAKDIHADKQTESEINNVKLAVVVLRVSVVASAALALISLAGGFPGVPAAAFFVVVAHEFYQIGENIADIHLRAVPTSVEGVKTKLSSIWSQLRAASQEEERAEAIALLKSYLKGTFCGLVVKHIV